MENIAYDTTGFGDPQAAVLLGLGAISQMTGQGGKALSGDNGLYAALAAGLTGSMFLSCVVSVWNGLSGTSDSSKKEAKTGHRRVESKSIFMIDRLQHLRERIAINRQSLTDIKGAKVTLQAVEKIRRSVAAARADLEGFKRYARSSLRANADKSMFLVKELKNKAPHIAPKDGTNKSRLALCA
jgi:hypothetical protein